MGEGNKHRRAVKAEKQYMRMAIYPVLQAEEDRRCGSRHFAVLLADICLLFMA